MRDDLSRIAEDLLVIFLRVTFEELLATNIGRLLRERDGSFVSLPLVYLRVFLVAIWAALMVVARLPTEIQAYLSTLDEGTAAAVRIRKVPGQLLVRFAEAVFSRKSRKAVFEPLLSDMEIEYCDALAEGRPKKAAWVRFKYTFLFWQTVILHGPVGLARQVVQVWKLFG